MFSVSVPGCTAMTPQHSIKKGSTLTHFQANVISYNRKLIKESRPLRNEKTEPHGKDFSTFWVFLLFFFSSVIKARDLTLPIESNSLSATSILLSLKKQLFLPLLSFSWKVHHKLCRKTVQRILLHRTVSSVACKGKSPISTGWTSSYLATQNDFWLHTLGRSRVWLRS